MATITVERTLFLLASILLAQACLPIPHHEQRSPAVVGTILRGDAPVAGLPVRVVAHTMRESCAVGDEDTRTDAQGRFALPAVHQFFWVAWLLGDPTWSYRLCVNDDTGWREIYAAHGMPLPRSTDRDSVTCDLALPRPDSTRTVARETTCRAL